MKNENDSYVFFSVGAATVMNLTQHQDVLRFPSDEDLNGAAVAVTRLQDTYKLDTHAIAEGMLLGKKYSHQLTGIRSQIATHLIYNIGNEK